MIRKNGMVLFWNGIFSQWYSHDMIIDGVPYNCCEQYMMAEKARLFGDEAALKKIMALKDPKDQKACGRTVKNFDKVKWDAACKTIVYRANMAKFSDPELNEYLMSFGDDEIVEASPYDTIWGIGLGENDPRALDKSKWRGSNWLGEVIMQVRNDLRGKDTENCAFCTNGYNGQPQIACRECGGTGKANKFKTNVGPSPTSILNLRFR